MRLKILAGLSITALLFASGEAEAGQSVAYKSSWTGFHAGVTGGYGWGHSELSAIVQGVSEDGNTDLHGGMIGGLAGYDYDFGNGIVAGIVADMSWSGINGGSCIQNGGSSFKAAATVVAWCSGIFEFRFQRFRSLFLNGHLVISLKICILIVTFIFIYKIFDFIFLSSLTIILCTVC